MKLSFLILVLFITSYSFSQNDDKALFDKADIILEAEAEVFTNHCGSTTIDRKTFDLITTELIKQALIYIDELIEKYPESTYYNEALFIKAQNEQTIGNNEVAKINFENLIQRKAVKARQLFYSYLGLAQIAVDQKDYKSALKYLDEIDKHPREYFCGTERNTEKTLLENLRKTCIAEMNKK